MPPRLQRVRGHLLHVCYWELLRERDVYGLPRRQREPPRLLERLGLLRDGRLRPVRRRAMCCMRGLQQFTQKLHPPPPPLVPPLRGVDGDTVLTL